MNREQAWKNFELGTELEISGSFIYNGLKCFHELTNLDRTAAVFEFLYNISVGLERLLKIAVILVEHTPDQNQEAFERSLITHNHLELITRLKNSCALALAGPHNEFLQLLATFYKGFRYDRYVLRTSWNPDKEKNVVKRFLEKHLQVVIEPQTSILPCLNEDRFRKFMGKLVCKISGEVYRVIFERANALHLYTYEFSSSSKASKVFLRGDCTFLPEDILVKELLIFFMNARAKSGLLKVMKGVEPLDFDEALAAEYVQCFLSDEAKQDVMGEVHVLYDELEKPAKQERFQLMSLIGDPDVHFDDEEDLGEENWEDDVN